MKRFKVYYLHCVCPFCAHQREPRYVGLTTVTLHNRRLKHLKDTRVDTPGDRRLLDWIRKHGPKNIRIELIQEYASDVEMKAGEVHWIAEYRARGYDLTNMTDGGDGFVGGTHTEEWKRQASIRARGRAISSETRKAIGDGNRGKVRTIEQREHLRALNTGKKATDVTRAKISRSQAGRVITEDHARKIGDSLQGHEVLPDSREKIRVANIARYADESERARGRANLQKASHVRWHVNRDVTSQECEHCETENIVVDPT